MEDDKIITLLDENEKEEDFEIIATLEVDNFKYAILLSLQHDTDEAMVFRIVEEDNEYILECVEDDEEFNNVAAAYEQLSENNKGKE